MGENEWGQMEHSTSVAVNFFLMEADRSGRRRWGVFVSWELTCGLVPRHISRVASMWRQLGRNSLQTCSGRSFDRFRDLEEPVRPILLFREETRTRPRVQGVKRTFPFLIHSAQDNYKFNSPAIRQFHSKDISPGTNTATPFFHEEKRVFRVFI